MVSLTTAAKMLWVSPGGLGLSAIVAGTRWLRTLLGKMTGLTVLLATHALPHTRTEPEAGPDTLGVDEKTASSKELEEVADWAYQSVLAVHLCRLGLAQESDALVVDCGCGPVWTDAWKLYLRALAWLCTCPGQRSSESGDASKSARSHICCPSEGACE